MNKFTAVKANCFFVVITLLFLVSCNTKHHIPFPDGETEFVQPVSRVLHLPEPVKISWIVNKEDSLDAPVEKPFDINSIPSKPFCADGFKPFTIPVTEEKIDWDHLPGTGFDIDTVPSKPVVYKTIKTEAPVRIKAGIPKTKTPVSKNIIQFGQEENLPAGVVQQIYQDKKGIYWIATGKGLCRYDGEYFELFSFISKEPEGSIQVVQMMEDNTGTLWIRTRSRGIYLFDYTTGIAKKFESNGYDLVADYKGYVWMPENNEKIRVIDPVKLTAQTINARLLSDSGEVSRIIEGDKNQVLFRTGEGISIFDRQQKKIYQWHSKAVKDYSTIYYFLKNSAGNILTGTNEGIDVIDPGNSSVKHFTHVQGISNSPAPYDETEDNKGRIWHARKDSGIEVLDLQGNTILKLGKSDGLSENSISCLYSDSAGQMWIGTSSGGINIINNNISINHLSVNQGLSNNAVWSLIQDDSGNTWVGSRGGIDVLNTKKQTIKHFDKEIQAGTGSNALPKLMKDKDGKIWVMSNGNALSIIDLENKRVKIFDAKYLPFRRGGIRLLGDRKGMVWITTFGEGVVQFDPQKNIFRHLTDSNGLSGNLPWTLLQDKDGRIWVATSTGISIVEANGEWVRTLHKSDGLSDNVTQALAQDSLGRMWVSTNEGVDMIDLNKKTITAFTKKQGMTENESYALEVFNGKVYAGTGGGISIIENAGKGTDQWKVNTFARPQGFYYIDVNSNTSLVSKEGKIWWGIQQALTVMDEPQQDSTVKPAFITGIEINGIQQYFYATGKSITAAGLADTIWSEQKDTFYTKENISRSFDKGNGIKWAGSEGFFNMPVALELAHDQNQLSFQFTGMHTDNADKTRYRFILEGLDDHWSSITEESESPDYNNLSAGEYTFKVCSKGANGVWSKPAEFSFTILSPWWKTWWAYIFYALIFVAMVRAYILYRSRRLQLENIILEEKISQRTNELKQSIDDLKSTQSQLIQSEKMASLGELTAGIAHEIQNPLNFVNNFSEVNKELLAEMNEEITNGNYEEVKAIAKDVTENEEKINHHGKRADAIVKGMLQHSRSSNATKEPTDINKLADEYLRLAYHGLRAKDKTFNATLKTNYDESIGNINIIPQDIGRVILNLITNAFYAVNEKKKAFASAYEPTVSINTKRVNNKIEISVADNGNGIPSSIKDKIFQPFFTTKPTGQGTGLGLSLSYDIIKAHGGELMVQSIPGTGTAFIISLPQTGKS